MSCIVNSFGRQNRPSWSREGPLPSLTPRLILTTHARMRYGNFQRAQDILRTRERTFPIP